MKIIAILENEQNSGGGFFQSINAILQMKRVTISAKLDFEVFTSKVSNMPILENYGIKAFVFKTSLFDKFVALLVSNELTRRIQEKFKFIGTLEKKLIKHQCKLLYFLGPTARMGSIQRLNFIATVWDNCSRDYPEFPEVSKFGEYQRREYIFKNLSRAYMVIVDSDDLKNKIVGRYQVNEDRVVVIPFSLNPFLSIKKTDGFEKRKFLKSQGIEEGYFFYPAQFWPHKNHIRILEALAILENNGISCKCVFVGGKLNNFNHIENMIKRYNLSNSVKVLGFIDSGYLECLYEASLAVIMPTYFGPTNIPPLEAWFYGKPLIYSRHLSAGFSGSVLECEADDAESLASAMKDILLSDFNNNIIQNGKEQLNKISVLINKSDNILLNNISRFKNRLHCWDSVYSY